MPLKTPLARIIPTGWYVVNENVTSRRSFLGAVADAFSKELAARGIRTITRLAKRPAHQSGGQARARSVTAAHERRCKSACVSPQTGRGPPPLEKNADAGSEERAPQSPEAMPRQRGGQGTRPNGITFLIDRSEPEQRDAVIAAIAELQARSGSYRRCSESGSKIGLGSRDARESPAAITRRGGIRERN